MTKDTMRKVQEQFVKEAVVLLAEYGENTLTDEWEEAIVFVGEACGIPQAETLRRLTSIMLERRLLAEGGGRHIYSDEALRNRLNAYDTMGFVWDILEASTAIQDQQKRWALYNLAFQFADIHGLREFLEKHGRPGQADEQDEDEAPGHEDETTGYDRSAGV